MNIKEILRVDKIRMEKIVLNKDNPMQHVLVKVDELKVDKKYQRAISIINIKKGGPLDLAKLTPIVICQRPDHLDEEDQGLWIIDGQHRAFRCVLADYHEPIGAMLYKHPEGTTLEECIKYESQLFRDLNTLAKKASKMDAVRAGIWCDDPDSLRILDVMETLNLTCDNFGSEKDTALEIEVFNHFYYLCLQDYASGMSKIQDGYALLRRLFPEEVTVNGYMIRACCLINEFVDKLTNGKKQSFVSYLENDWCKKSINAIKRGHGTMASPQYILHDAIRWHNDMKGSKTIGADLIARMSNPALGGNSRFKDPSDVKDS